MRFFEEYDGFYIDIDVYKIKCYLLPFIKWNEARIRTNINDNINDNINERRKKAYFHFKEFINSSVPKSLVNTVITEFDYVYYYEYDHVFYSNIF